MKTNAKLFSLNQLDLIKGAFLAAIVAILTTVYNSLQAGKLPSTWLEWQPILIFGVTAFTGYIIKNVLSNSNGVPLKAEPVVKTDTQIQATPPPQTTTSK